MVNVTSSLVHRALLPSVAVISRYGITRRTLGRWMLDVSMQFPEPITINGRHYFDADDLTAWERARVGRRSATQAEAVKTA